jgi:hypothetical protein
VTEALPEQVNELGSFHTSAYTFWVILGGFADFYANKVLNKIRLANFLDKALKMSHGHSSFAKPMLGFMYGYSSLQTSTW